MSEYEELVAELTEQRPHLILVMSGPWKDRLGLPVDEPWICNFKNSSLHNREVHPGSCGRTMLEALKSGLAFLDAKPEVAHNYDCGYPPCQGQLRRPA